MTIHNVAFQMVGLASDCILTLALALSLLPMEALALTYHETYDLTDLTAYVGQPFEGICDLSDSPSGDTYIFKSIASVTYNAQIGLTVSSSGNTLVVSGTPTAAFDGVLCTVTCKTGPAGMNTLYAEIRIKVTQPITAYPIWESIATMPTNR